MAKNLKIEIFSADGFNKALVRVVEQSNFGKKFGNQRGDLRKFTAASGITLASNRFPSRDTEDKNTYWVQGVDSDKNDRCFYIPVSKIDKLVAAVEEYNAYYTQSAVNARVRQKRAAQAAAEEAVRLAAEAEARRLAALPKCFIQTVG